MLVERALKPSYKEHIRPMWNDLHQMIIRLPHKVKNLSGKDVKVTLKNVCDLVDLQKI